MEGLIVKIFSDFYYVKTDAGIVEAKLRTVLKKQKTQVYTGDFVMLEQVDLNSMQGFISKVLNRKSVITKPKAANITQAVIVSALKEPDLNFEQLNRYIAFCNYHKIKLILCFNKEDIKNTDSLKEMILKIYEPLNYTVIFTSALERKGLEELKPVLKENISILCGSSGAGKSSLINALLNQSRQKTLPVSEKTKKGVHTTRHCELICLDKNSFIVDTPGFSHLKFDFISPSDIQNLFEEFKKEKLNCRYKNCLHSGENGCAYKDVINNMETSRYLSYKKFIEEAKEYEKRILNISTKNETAVKYNKNKLMTKISSKNRTLSRKTINQNVKKDNYGR